MASFFRRSRRAQSTRPVQARLSLESLEERAVPATFTVMNDADTGAGSLRQAIITANTTAGADIINFDPTVFTAGKTINLSNANDKAGQNVGYTVNDSVTINGPGVLNLTLNGAGNGGARIMTVDHTQAGDDGTASANAAAITVAINNLTFAGANTTGPGGALGNFGDNVTMQTTHFENNTVAGAGGAVTTTIGGILTVRQSSFVNNTAGTGGSAIVAGGGSSGMLTIENSTFSGNRNTGLGANSGGAIDILNGVNSTLTNNTISGNSSAAAGQGGGVLVESNAGQATLTGNIIFGNTSNGMADDVHTSAPGVVGATSGFNDIGVYTNTGGSAAALTTGMNGNISADPMLGMLTTLANGTRAFTPAAASPVVNTLAAGFPATDQAGNVRPAGMNGDMGSIEFGAVPPPVGGGGGGGGGGGSTTTSPITPAQVATAVNTATTTPPIDPRVPLNAQVLSNLRDVFGQPIPPNSPVAFAQIVNTSDLNGDGFADMLSVVALRVRVNGRPALRVFLLSFDGLSPNGALLPNGVTLLDTVPA